MYYVITKRERGSEKLKTCLHNIWMIPKKADRIETRRYQEVKEEGKVIIEKSRGEVSLMEQDTIEKFS